MTTVFSLGCSIFYEKKCKNYIISLASKYIYHSENIVIILVSICMHSKLLNLLSLLLYIHVVSCVAPSAWQWLLLCIIFFFKLSVKRIWIKFLMTCRFMLKQLHYSFLISIFESPLRLCLCRNLEKSQGPILIIK